MLSFCKILNLFGSGTYNHAYTGNLVFVLLVFRLIIEYTENSSIPEWRGYVVALAMLVTAFLQSIFIHQYFHIAFSTGMRLRTCVLGLVYKKVKYSILI